MNRRGFSLVEVVVSAIILALLIIGMTNVFISGKRYILHGRSRITSAELGRLFLDPLQMHVRHCESATGAQDGWDESNNALSITAGFRYCDSDPGHTQQPSGFCHSQFDRTLDGIEYSARYSILNHTQDNNIRRVVATVNWNERTP